VDAVFLFRALMFLIKKSLLKVNNAIKLFLVEVFFVFLWRNGQVTKRNYLKPF
jgi:hypothetical protein